MCWIDIWHLGQYKSIHQLIDIGGPNICIVGGRIKDQESCSKNEAPPFELKFHLIRLCVLGCPRCSGIQLNIGWIELNGKGISYLRTEFGFSICSTHISPPRICVVLILETSHASNRHFLFKGAHDFLSERFYIYSIISCFPFALRLDLRRSHRENLLPYVHLDVLHRDDCPLLMKPNFLTVLSIYSPYQRLVLHQMKKALL